MASYCFQSAYIHEILRNGYGFQDTDSITATNIINGQKVSWALGSMVYEINTLPWDYIEQHSGHHMEEQIREDVFVNWKTHFVWFVALVTAVVMMLFYRVLRLHRKNKDKNSVEIEKLPLRMICVDGYDVIVVSGR